MINPKFFNLSDVAMYCTLSVSTLEKCVRQGTFPKPRLLSPHRVGWLVSEVDAWCESRPVSELLPPRNTGAKKPKKTTPLTGGPES